LIITELKKREVQFIENGPDIPNTLLQAHDDVKVIFFCGAGISYPAGLPGFQGLVDKKFSNKLEHGSIQLRDESKKFLKPG